MFKAVTATPFASLTGKEIVASDGATTSYSVSDGTKTYTFYGTLAHQAVTSGDFGWNASTGAFSQASGSGVSIDAFRGYIRSSSGSLARLNVNFDDETSGIETMNREPLTVNQTYNLSGQRVSQPTKGLYIVNGKKVVVK